MLATECRERSVVLLLGIQCNYFLGLCVSVKALKTLGTILQWVKDATSSSCVQFFA